MEDENEYLLREILLERFVSNQKTVEIDVVTE
jgi:hypothetical protein